MALTKADVLARTTEMSQEEWKALRRKGIGGSDIGAICGVNPWRSAYSVYLDKIGELPEKEPNDAMLFGTLIEPIVADVFVERTGYKVQRRNAILQHPDHPWAIANVDRIILSKERGNGVLEIKTASEYQAKQWEEGNVPEQYILQLQWYLFVTGFRWGAFAALVGGNKFFCHEMERDEVLIENMLTIAKDFWHCVETKTPPTMDGSEDATNVLKILYPTSRPETEIELDAPEAKQWVEQLEQAKAAKKEAEALEREAENHLKALMGETEIARIGEHKITWKTVISRTLDKKALESDHPEILEKYMKESVSRRFTLK
ncbi:YqaJ viral recombinase family protein [Alicyclobacillus tolerans]|uniref:YqaJ viral recombinase family nuclease n=1 Tax=Alicyclobacillus tolerans TaxID=90970 RepID=UPI003B792923